MNGENNTKNDTTPAPAAASATSTSASAPAPATTAPTTTTSVPFTTQTSPSRLTALPQQVKKFLPTNWTLLVIFIAIIGYKILDNTSGSYDSDMWWLLATGREIIENGIPYTNPWTMFDGLGIVVQQWLTSVILYSTYSAFGYLGIKILVFLLCVVMAFVLFGVCRVISGRRAGSGEVFGFIIAVAIFSLASYLSERPHVYSMIFYALVVGVLEIYRRKNNYLVLFALPIITCVHVNIHSAMAPLDLVIIALYVIPDIPALLKRHTKFGKNISVGFSQSSYRRLPVLFALIVSAFALLINPYFIDGALYVVHSYGAANYGNYISEMGSTDFWNEFGIATMACIVLGAIAIGKKGIRNIDVPLTCLFIGCIPVSMMHVRNVWLVSLFAVLLFVSAFKDVSINNEKLARFVSNKAFHITFIVVLALVGTGWYVTQKWDETAKNAETDSTYVPSLAMNYLDDYVSQNNVEKSSLKIYNPFNCGGYLEWRGYKVYMDQRPELWEPDISGSIIHYYKTYVDAQDSTESASRTISTYNFDFVVAFANSKMETHLKNNSQYKQVVSGTGYTLYARSDLNAEVNEDEKGATIDDLKNTSGSGVRSNTSAV